MYAPNGNTAPKGLRGWWAAPPRSGMRRMISPWERTSRSSSIGAILVVVSLVLVGCTSGPSKTAGRETSTSESGRSSTSTTVTSVPAAKLIEPSGPVSARPALLDNDAGWPRLDLGGLPERRHALLDCISRLRAGPQLLNVPKVSGRYVDFQLLDMYTNTIADVGVLTGGGHGGTYAFTGPGWHGTIPKGVVRIDVPTPDAWLLGRTQVKRPADLLAAVELEAQYSLAALSGHGSGTTGGPSTLACPAPVPALQSSTSLGFLGDLGKDMAADPPMAVDGPVVQAMAAAGIGPGRTPGAAGSSNAAEYLKALGLGGRLLAGTAGEGEGSTTPWTGSTRGAVVGSYGTDYLERASLAKETLGTQVPTQAVYFSASRARSGMTTTALAGTRSYEIRFPAEDLPPHGSDGFWSITLYNAAGSLAANPIDRYSIGDDTPGLVRGADRSLTIVVSASRPSETDVNWLPTPRGAFSLVLRVYDPAPQVLDGSWSLPVIRAIS